jgi:hypothetical protein
MDPDVTMEVDNLENEIILARLAAVAANDPNNEPHGGNPNPRLAKYTDADMPEIHDVAPMALLEGIDKDQLLVWLQTATGKVLARPLDREVGYQPNHLDIAKTLISAVNEITGQTNIAVAAPNRADKKNTNRRKHPITFLIHNLSPSGALTLLERKVWSLYEISFQVSPMNTEKPNFLFTLIGLSTQEVEHVCVLIAAAWKDTVTEAFIKNLIKQAPLWEQQQLANDIENFLNSTTVTSLDIKSKGGRKDPTYNIYADSKTLRSDETWTEICNFLKGHKYSSPLCRKGTARPSFYYCSLCHGCDHPRGLCKFPKIPGWNGGKRYPTPSTLTPSENSRPTYDRSGPRGPPHPSRNNWVPSGNSLNVFPRKSN